MFQSARLAQSVEHQTFNLRVKGSSPLSGGREFFFLRQKEVLYSFLIRKLKLFSLIAGEDRLKGKMRKKVRIDIGKRSKKRSRLMEAQRLIQERTARRDVGW